MSVDWSKQKVSELEENDSLRTLFKNEKAPKIAGQKPEIVEASEQKLVLEREVVLSDWEDKVESLKLSDREIKRSLNSEYLQTVSKKKAKVLDNESEFEYVPMRIYLLREITSDEKWRSIDDLINEINY